jgi:hypothetical protein
VVTRTRPALLFKALAVAALLISPATVVPAAGGETSSLPPTPVLIERAVERGDIDRATADLYLAAALHGDPVPSEFRSPTPFRGTLPLLELNERLERLPAGAHRRALSEELHPVGTVGTDECGGVATPMPNTVETPHFYIEYPAALGGGMTIDTYISALETSWTKQVDEYGWARPPTYPPNPAPNNKYPVRIENLGPTLYGFVANSGTHAGSVGNNPATAWNEGDSFASCMVLNANYDPFPGAPLAALQATAAHEFNHTIHFGWGVTAGSNVPDLIFIEGGAAWMEDEVFDDANDNYNFLWPDFNDDMGQYQDSALDNPYEYWITWRGMTEPFGTGITGGGEDVMQRFWELTSRNEKSGLEAMDTALSTKGSSLAGAYHSYAIAVKFAKACSTGYVPPHCLEEGPGYVAAKGPNASHGSVTMNATYIGALLDNYALNWIDLPQGTDLQVGLKNTSSAGRFRASVACDTGTGLVVAPFTSVVDAGETAFVRSYSAATCPAPIAVITNVTQTGANPPASELRSYSLTVTPPAQPSSLSVSGRLAKGKILAKGKLSPAEGGGKVEVTLFRKDRKWKEVKARSVNVGTAGTFRAKFPSPDTSRCRVEAEFAGDTTRLPSSDRRAFRC